MGNAMTLTERVAMVSTMTPEQVRAYANTQAQTGMLRKALRAAGIACISVRKSVFGAEWSLDVTPVERTQATIDAIYALAARVVPGAPVVVL